MRLVLDRKSHIFLGLGLGPARMTDIHPIEMTLWDANFTRIDHNFLSGQSY